MTKISRRQLISLAAPATIGAAIGFTNTEASGNNLPYPVEKKMKIIVVGAHPDDPESACGGLMALYAAAGHDVVSAYLTRGEAGIKGKSHEESARIRTAEALKACEILKVRPVFLGQIDGNCEITHENYEAVSDLFKIEQPDIVLTHWPIDTHRDHRICSILVYDAWLNLGRKSALYYFECMSGQQSQNFAPTDYIDISAVIKQKHDACFIHLSQEVEEIYKTSHAPMEIFRGMEFGCEYAEAYVRHVQNPGIYLK
jgi:LmbE family N-acetylglucosaminyl deacetylase